MLSLTRAIIKLVINVSLVCRFFFLPTKCNISSFWSPSAVISSHLSSMSAVGVLVIGWTRSTSDVLC